MKDAVRLGLKINGRALFAKKGSRNSWSTSIMATLWRTLCQPIQSGPPSKASPQLSQLFTLKLILLKRQFNFGYLTHCCLNLFPQ